MFWNVSYSSVTCLLILLKVYFEELKFLIGMPCMFSFIVHAFFFFFWSYLRNLCLAQGYKYFLKYSRSFILLGLCNISNELFFMVWERVEVYLFFPYRFPVVPSYLSWLNCLGICVKTLLFHMIGLTSELFIVFYPCTCLFLLQYYPALITVDSE